MMTIKEMHKVFRKVSKLEDKLSDARSNFFSATFCEYAAMQEAATTVVKAIRGLQRIADAMGVTIDTLTSYTASEENFMRWILIEGIEMTTNSGDESEEETEEDNDE